MQWWWTAVGGQKRHLRGAQRCVCVWVCVICMSEDKLMASPKNSTYRTISVLSHRHAFQVGTMFCQLAQRRDLSRTVAQSDWLAWLSQSPHPRGGSERCPTPLQLWSTSEAWQRGTLAKVYSFLHLECKWHTCPWFVIIFLTSDTDVHFVLNSVTPPSTYTVWQLVQCDITWYIFTIHYNVSWKSSILFYVICLPSYRPYNLLEKKTLELFCMLCNLCFVSVKKVEKRVSWLLVSVEMAPSEIVVEDNFLVLHNNNKKNQKNWFPGHGNLRSHATAPSPPLVPYAPLFPYAASSPVPTQARRQTQIHTNTHTDIVMHTRWPVLLRRREMLSNSAFQHSTSDYLFSFTGRFELVMYFPFSVGLASLSVSLSLSFILGIPLSSACDPLGQNLRGQTSFHTRKILCCLTETLQSHY